MLSYLKHNALVTLGTSRLPNCMVVNSMEYIKLATCDHDQLRCQTLPACARAVYTCIVYHAGNTVRGGGGGGGTVFPRELSPVN